MPRSRPTWSRAARASTSTSLGRRGVAKIVGWSLAAAVSIVCVVLFGVPLAADRLAPLVPKPFERRIGDVVRSPGQDHLRRQGLRPCGRASGLRQARHRDLRDAAGLDTIP